MVQPGKQEEFLRVLEEQEIARRILRNFRRGVIDRTRQRALRTTLLEVRSQFAEFRQVRLVSPCLYTYQGHLDVTPNRRVLRQVLLRRMADENLNWKLEREVLLRSEPTGAKAACPP